MTYPDIPSRQRSRRLISRMKSQANSHHQQFQTYKQRQKTINNIMELLPGLNDISDAFEALPLDLIKYFTLLKEIDAKSINTIPQINNLVDRYVDKLHPSTDLQVNSGSIVEGASNGSSGSENSANGGENTTENTTENTENTTENTTENATNTVSNATSNATSNTTNPALPQPFAKEDQFKHLSIIKNKIREIFPCLEEKMQVTRAANDLLSKHMMRINLDYKLIINNNEIPESIRIGPLNHPAMIMDPAINNNNPDRTVQAVRSESRREALAAKKASKEEETKRRGGRDANSVTPPESSPAASGGTTNLNLANSTVNNSGNGSGNSSSGTKKRGRDEIIRSTNPFNGKKKKAKKEEVDEEIDTKIMKPSSTPKSGEPTYCYCNQVSFGEMVGCDGDDCKREWFHLPCIGFKNPPKGKWYCEDCTIKMKKAKRI